VWRRVWRVRRVRRVRCVDICGNAQGWDKYSGGLDTEGREGKNSIYMLRKDYEIMFHVSTYLPFSTKNDQQVERKKHIGTPFFIFIICYLLFVICYLLFVICYLLFVIIC
jgi:hypothetical protein